MLTGNLSPREVRPVGTEAESTAADIRLLAGGPADSALLGQPQVPFLVTT